MAKSPADAPDGGNNGPVRPTRSLKTPNFGQPRPTEDPKIFRVKHPSDGDAYKALDELNEEHKLQAKPFPAPRGGTEPRLTLEDVFGGNTGAIDAIEKNKQIVLHALGDCGSTRGPKSQNEVADKMVGDFKEAEPREIPQFCMLLGDIVYSFGEPEYYYDQFYEPYRDYTAPILAAAGNHDGMISPLAHARSLEAYLRNFCSDPANGFVVTPEAGGLSRTAQIQPGVFFTFEAPFVRILVFYSNVLEDPGVIANNTIGQTQLDFLRAALKRIKEERYDGALMFAHHHPCYAYGGQHSSSTEMRQQMDKICEEEGVWPHAVLAGHAHSYQRFTRRRADGTEIPYLICGNGGHNHQKLHAPGGIPLRVPQVITAKSGSDDEVSFDRYDDAGYGYLRLVVDADQLRIEYHPSSDGISAKTPDDSVTVDIRTRKRTTYTPNSQGFAERVNEVRATFKAQTEDRTKNQTAQGPHANGRKA
jgi:Calcineurin-like phosphoesterase